MAHHTHRRSRARAIWVLLGLAILLLGTPISADDAASETALSPAAHLFERMKGLVGTWRSDGERTATSVYALTGNGTVITEHYSRAGGDDHDMLTVYHLDGDRLMLTHYCIADNQPRMVARLDPERPDHVEFEFLDATGLGSPDEGHMHRAVFDFDSDDHMTQQWVFHQDGRPVMEEVERYTRVP